jgi:RNA polymerase sigma-70 factor (ECF subfamily)
MAKSEEHLISRIAAGDRDAFAELYDRYSSRLFGLILRLLRNRTESEDVLQEVFLQVWAQATRFESSRSSLDVWLLMIARSRGLDRLRRRTVPVVSELPEPATTDDPGCDAENAEQAEQIRTALGQLPADQREPICLAFFEGLTHEQIALRLNVPLGTVKTRIRLGMIRLRDRFSCSLVAGATS